LDGKREDSQRDDGQAQGHKGDVVGVENGDNRDRKQVINYCEGEQECAQCRRKMTAHNGDDRHGECDVGGGRDRPAVQCRPSRVQVDQHVYECRNSNASHSGGDRDDRRARVAQFADDELLF
jgi:hypothetical protein